MTAAHGCGSQGCPEVGLPLHIGGAATVNLIEKTKLIQRAAGAAEDGIYGNDAADKLLRKLGIDPTPAISSVAGILVKGTGKNISRVFIHCSATREGQDIDAATIKRWHVTPVSQGGRGWKDIGYHFVIRLDGTVEVGRPENIPGAHVAGFNTGSIGVVYVGGLDAQGRPKDTRTDAQKAALASLCRQLGAAYPGVRFRGHRDASPDRNGDGKITPDEWLKDCPCFDVASWLISVGIDPK